ncbi:MAG: hypothetical protein MJ016_04160, partial [Victivallaceae bacterium]|nr:hypothetical protein [Victivallaceae bacterium]
AANITSTNAISVEENTSLVLDLSVYAGTTTKELLTNYNTMFGESQKDLTISINVASDQTFGKYVLATGVDTLRQTEFTITLDGDTEKSFTVSVGGGMAYGSNYYSLDLADGTLSLTIQGQGDVGVVTFDGGTDTVVIAGATYTGKAYREEDIGLALDQKQIVAAQDVTLSGFTVSSGQTFVGDRITMSGVDAVIYNEGAMVLSGKITTAANITSTKAVAVADETQLVLDLSVRTPDMKELLTNFNTMFGESQSNLSITVNVDQEQTAGVYTLATNATSCSCPITLDIDNESVAQLDVVTKVVSGEKTYRIDWNNLDLQFIVEDVLEGKIFGGDTILSEDTAVSEVARLNIKEGSFVAAAGGVYATNCRVDINTDTNVSVADGSFSNIVCAGSVVNENTVLTVNDASRLTISGGTFANAVAGGNYIQKEGGTVYGGRGTRASNTHVDITGGTFLRDIFGGNIAAQNSFATRGNSYITGSTNITIDTSENVVSIEGNLVAGSSGLGIIIGSSNLTFTGSADNLIFGNKSIVCGDSHDATTAVSCVGSANTVRRFLTFDGFSGVLDAKVVGFDQVSISGGSVTLTKSSRLSDISVWDFSDGATLTFGDADNDFHGDALFFGTFDGNEWTVATADDAMDLVNWDWAGSVSIAGQNASFKDGCWTSDDYKFYKEDNALKVAKLA